MTTEAYNEKIRGDVGTALGILCNIRDGARNLAGSLQSAYDDECEELQYIIHTAKRGIEILRPYLNGQDTADPDAQ